MRYYHRLTDFDTLLREHGGNLGETVAFLTKAVKNVSDPFEVLPGSDTP